MKPDPTGVEPRKLLAVKPYAYTYTGCSGAIATDAAARQVWRPLPTIGGANVAAPTVVGGFQVIPESWEGDDLHYGLFSPPPSYSVPMSTTVLAEARNLPFWRDLPEGWVFLHAGTGAHDDPHYGYCSKWIKGEHYVEVCGGYAANRESPIRGRASTPDSQLAQINELRVVGAYVFAVTYYTNISDSWSAPIYVHVFDDDAQSYHSFEGRSISLSGSNVNALVEVATSVFAVSE